MAQTTILGRIGQLVRANINALLDSAEDPEQMLDQLAHVRARRAPVARSQHPQRAHREPPMAEPQPPMVPKQPPADHVDVAGIGKAFVVAARPGLPADGGP